LSSALARRRRHYGGRAPATHRRTHFAVEFRRQCSRGSRARACSKGHAIVPARMSIAIVSSDASGGPDADGGHLGYALSIYDASAGIRCAGARDAEPSSCSPMRAPRTPDRTRDPRRATHDDRRCALSGLAPTLTIRRRADGLQSSDDRLFYCGRPTAVDPAANAHRARHRARDQRHGVRLGDRYALAREQLRVPDGRATRRDSRISARIPGCRATAPSCSTPRHSRVRRVKTARVAATERWPSSVCARLRGASHRRPLNPSREGLADAVALRR
jgi:hypothetical protein